MRKRVFPAMLPPVFAGAERRAPLGIPGRGMALLAAPCMVLALACGDTVASDPGTNLVERVACVPGELTLPDGRCLPAGLPPELSCDPGEVGLADGRCQPAGVPADACADGFEADGRDGCGAVLPEDACPPGTMAVPGMMACRAIASCGEGTWGDIPVDATTEFVDAGYAGGGSTGTRERPWTTIGAGIQAAARGAIVAVAEGTYEEDVVIDSKPVRLWGRCPELVRVVGVGENRATIWLPSEASSGSAVRGLAVTGPMQGISVTGAREVVLEGLHLQDVEHFGIRIVDRARVTVRGVLVERSVLVGVSVGSAEATIEGTVVRATRPGTSGEFGQGIIVHSEAASRARGKAVIARSLIEENPSVGIGVEGADAEIVATVVRGRNDTGIGVQANPAGERGNLVLKGSVIEDNVDLGVFGSDSEVWIEDTVVRRTQPGGGVRSPGRGIGVQSERGSRERGKLVLKRSLVEDNHDIGVFLAGVDAEIESTVVRRTLLGPGGVSGRGINVQDDEQTSHGASLTLKGSVLEENHEVGVFIGGAEATIESTAVRATHPNRKDKAGRGIHVENDTETGARGRLSLRTSLLEQNHGSGLSVFGSDATVESTIVRGTRPSPAGADFGDGIVILDAFEGRSTLDIAATLVAENTRAGILYVGSVGVVSGVKVAGNQFGIVLQRGLTGEYPTVGDGNLFEGNAEQNRLTDGNLAVPDAISKLP